MSLLFEWDKTKELSNIRKHGLSFEDAMVVFADPLAKIFPDEWHSLGERREIILGHARDRRLLVVVFCELRNDRIRIVSARQATAKERRGYDRNSK